ncbi:fatty-acyl-CoA synthase [Prauserella flava]|uniref:AMP-binding protein n=1 Tax=Prauserella salsuginis TaxID=387889 RepID=A0ABW6G3U8_9PSEU|nr:fatty-acyl-CoA synthase [Prauserella flava]MCR3732957.1 fatty-acyl-CoA synthase [Prauserella salsuginis]
MFRWRAVNLLSLLSGLTKHDPHAIIAIDADPVQPVHVSRSELWRRTLQLRADLATAGVGRGDVVAVCLPNWSDLFGWQIATASLGACALGLDPAAPVADLARAVTDARPRVLALDRDVPVALIDRLRAERAASPGDPAPAVAVVPGPRSEPPVDPSPWDLGGGAWQPSAATAGMPMPETGGDEPAVAFAPGLACYRESVVVRHATSTATALGLGDGDLVVCTRPATRPIAWSFALAALAGGATYLFDPNLDESTLPGELARFGATHLAADEPTAMRLAKSCHAHGRDAGASLPALRWVGIANATSADAAQSLDELGIPARGFYAPSGVLAPFAVWPTGRPTADRWLGGGHPVCADIDIRVTDPESGEPTAAGERGVIELRGACVPEPRSGTDETADAEWFTTGDLGTLTAGGDVRYDGSVHHDA